MAFTEINGINIHDEVPGSGPPLLMMAPGGFDSTIEKWRNAGVWAGVRPLETLTNRYTCIVQDRREAGLSDGKVERVTWATQAHEAMGLLKHLGIEQACIMGACMGCSTAASFAVTYPEAALGLVLHYPVGGVRWRLNGLNRFQSHVNYVKEHGLVAVFDLAQERKSFWTDPNAGPWASTIVADPEFASSFVHQDVDRYLAVVTTMGRTLFDRDTAPGAEREELMALKVPVVIISGADDSHATSAARYLHECLPKPIYHDIHASQQKPDMVRQWILDFLDAHAGVGVV